MDKENKLTGIELFEKFGIDSITYDSGNAEDPNIPFSKFDTYNTMIIKYMDGRTEEMKRANIYRLKLLKQRDGDFLKSQIKLTLNPTYLTLENDQFVEA